MSEKKVGFLMYTDKRNPLHFAKEKDSSKIFTVMIPPETSLNERIEWAEHILNELKKAKVTQELQKTKEQDEKAEKLKETVIQPPSTEVKKETVSEK